MLAVPSAKLPIHPRETYSRYSGRTLAQVIHKIVHLHRRKNYQKRPIIRRFYADFGHFVRGLKFRWRSRHFPLATVEGCGRKTHEVEVSGTGIACDTSSF